MASAKSEIDWQSKSRSTLERNQLMLNNAEISDISFICEGSDRKFYAHKYVLATTSCVFQTMFYGVFPERDSTVIKLSDTDEKSFEQFLTYLYTNECTVTTDNVGPILYLAKKYMVEYLAEQCVDFLERRIEAENVLSILEQARYFDKKELESACWHFTERYTRDVLNAESFKKISEKTLATLLNRDNLNILEVELFQAVIEWAEAECTRQNLSPTAINKRSVLGDVIYEVKFLSMTDQEFAQHVSKSGLFTNEELVPMYEKLLGVESHDLEWVLSKREPAFLAVSVTHQRVQFHRCKSPSLEEDWKYNSWEPERLCFSVSKDALFHGTRLFGNGKANSYDVTLEVKGAKVSRQYDNYHQMLYFNVMLKSPVAIKANEVVTLTARIKGPPSFKAIDGITSIQRHGVTVTFSDAPSPNHGTNISQGQFYNIILSI